MHNKLIGLHLDFWGFMAPFLCAIHCATLPFILAIFPLSVQMNWLVGPWVEWIFIFISILLAFFSLYNSYIKHHQDYKALYIAFVGFFLLLGSRFVIHGSKLEIIAIVIGGLLIAFAHLINWRLLKRHEMVWS